jgi:polysaccharide export outer membrane protein
MRRTIGILIVTFGLFFIGRSVMAAEDDYRLGFGDVVTATIWADGDEEGLQVRELAVRPDGKVALSMVIKQTDQYRLGPRDAIDVNVWGYSDIGFSGTIRSDGKIAYPLLGEVEVSGRTPVELAQHLTKALKKYVKDPNVTVNITRQRGIPIMEVLPATGLTADELTQSVKSVLAKYMSNPQVTLAFAKFRTTRVYVLGEVTTPGMYEITKSHCLLDAIGAAGGFTHTARKKEVYVVHKADGSYHKADLDRLLKKADLTQNYELEEGDIVYLVPNGLSFIKDVLPVIMAAYDIKHF